MDPIAKLDSSPEFVRAAELARRFSIPLGTVRQMTSKRQLPFVKIGHAVYYRLADIRAIFDASTIAARETLRPDGRRPS